MGDGWEKENPAGGGKKERMERGLALFSRGATERQVQNVKTGVLKYIFSEPTIP